MDRFDLTVCRCSGRDLPDAGAEASGIRWPRDVVTVRAGRTPAGGAASPVVVRIRTGSRGYHVLHPGLHRDRTDRPLEPLRRPVECRRGDGDLGELDERKRC